MMIGTAQVEAEAFKSQDEGECYAFEKLFPCTLTVLDIHYAHYCSIQDCNKHHCHTR